MAKGIALADLRSSLATYSVDNLEHAAYSSAHTAPAFVDSDIDIGLKEHVSAPQTSYARAYDTYTWLLPRAPSRCHTSPADCSSSVSPQGDLRRRALVSTAFH